MSQQYGMPASYDAWATAGPPEVTLVCPKCGADHEDMAELEPIGLGAHGLLKYPTYLRDPQGGPDAMRHVRGIVEQREHASMVSLWRCECGAIVADDGLVTAAAYDRSLCP